MAVKPATPPHITKTRTPAPTKIFKAWIWDFFMLTVLASLSTSRVCAHVVPGAWAAFDVWTLYQSPSVSVLSVKGFDSAKSLNLHVCLTWCIAATTVWRCLRKQKYLIYLVWFLFSTCKIFCCQPIQCCSAWLGLIPLRWCLSLVLSFPSVMLWIV